MSSENTFSSSGENAIQKSDDVISEETVDVESGDFLTYYDIDETVEFITQGDYKRIALQFPDELLHDSVPVYATLRRKLGPARDLYVLADTSYGSCCVDEVAASHVDADALVHYGHACLSQTSRLPVLYVFGRRSLNVKDCVDAVVDYLRKHESEWKGKLEVRHDVRYSHRAAEILEQLRIMLGPTTVLTYERLPTHTSPRSNDVLQDRTLPAETSRVDLHGEVDPELLIHSENSERQSMILWIGEESPTLTKLLMTSPGRDIISYSPRKNRVQIQSHLTNRLLMRRYALVQQARDADVFGILVGTLGVASYLPLMKHLRQILKKAHKKSYTVSVGKINPAKLANFMEIECWVWVSCSEGMVDSKEYLRPIITPFELEIALQPEPTWSGDYVFDFDQLLKNARDKGDATEGTHDDEEPMFSLVSGTYRKAKRYWTTDQEDVQVDGENSKSLTRQIQETSLIMKNSASNHFLHSRTYQGLDPRIGQDEPSILEQGRSGIAKTYTGDHSVG